ncbi:hypothetical protein ACFX15_024512 [Malus domestica]
MASGPTVGEGDRAREKQRFTESKVYTKKAFKGLKKNNIVNTTTNTVPLLLTQCLHDAFPFVTSLTVYSRSPSILDLSEFYYWTEDLPPVLESYPNMARSLTKPSLLTTSFTERFKCSCLAPLSVDPMEATKKAKDLVGNTWQHLKTSPNFADATMGRIAQGAKVLAECGDEKILPFVDGKRLVEEKESSPLPSCVSNDAGAEHCSGGQKPISDSSRQQGPSSQGSRLSLLLVLCCHSCRVLGEEGCVSEAAFIWLVFYRCAHG